MKIPGDLFVHNATLEAVSAIPGWRLSRYPEAVRDQLNYNARLRGLDSTMAEIRFVTPSSHVRVSLSSLEGDSLVRVYRGAFEHSQHVLPAGRVVVLSLDSPSALPPWRVGGWSSDVWRIICDRGPVYFHEIDALGGEIRSPHASEMPTSTWLAYGSSITHSTFFSYTGFAARDLGVDVLNKGLGGACHAEHEASDYLASLAWDFATLELGVNLRNHPDAEKFFEERVRYLVGALRKTHPRSPIVLITIFPNRDKMECAEENPTMLRQRFFDNTLRRVVKETNDPDLHIIEGNRVVDDLGILGCDLLHPSPHGSARMGANLARELRPILAL